MKKNINILTKELNAITELTNKNINIHTSSIFSILQYKLQLQKKKHLENKIKKLNDQKTKFVDKFDKKINNLLNDSKISCRKYCKLEPSLTYKKEKFLYKFGYISKRPLSPLEKNLSLKFSPIIKFFKSIISKIPFYKLNPKRNIRNLAIHTTKKCIKGYRKIENLKCSAKSNILKSSLIQKLLCIKSEALQQLEDEENKKNYDDSSDFFKRIRLNPNSMSELSNVQSPNHQKDSITYSR